MNFDQRARLRTSTLLAVAAVLVASAAPAQVCYDVSVFAGRGVGDNGPGAQAILIQPRSVAVEASGNLIIADSGNARVRRYDPAADVITTIAGNGALGAPEDGVPATATALGLPSGVALDGAGNVYIADELSDTVLQLTPDGILHRFAGTGVRTGSIDGDGVGDASDDLNDGLDAKLATLNHPLRVAVDGAGNVLISDSANRRIRMVDRATGRISTIAGNGTQAPGTPGVATASGFVRPVGLAFGPGGEVYVSDNGSAPEGPIPGAGHQVWQIAGGTLSLVAGEPLTGLPGVAPRAGMPAVPAVGAPLNGPGDLAVDSTGRVYIGDTGNNVVRRVAGGLIETVVGDTTFEYREGPAILARFRHPGVALSADGGALIIPDTDNNRIRRYDFAADATSTIVGGANDPGDGGPAVAAFLQRPTGLAIDAAGNVFVSEHDSHRIRHVDTGGTITTVVNADGLNGPPVPGQPAITQSLQQPTGLGFTAAGDLLIVDPVANQVYLVDGAGHGTIFFFAGTGGICPVATSGPPDPCGDGGPAPQATLNTPLRVATAADGSVFIADFGDHRIRRVDPQGIITTFAGRGFAGSGGDGGPAAEARFNNPSGLVFDGAGNLYVADFGNHKVRKIDTGGMVSTIAGTGGAGALGDGGAAGAAQLNKPTDLAFTADGALLIADQGNNKVRRIAPDANGGVSANGTISTVVGDGTAGFKDGPGPTAQLLAPTEVAVAADGSLLIADRGNQRVRKAVAAGTECPGATPCSSAADCDDDNTCTVDACEAGTCSHTLLPPDQCEPSCAAEPAGCIAGGGSSRTDCLAVALVKGLQPGQARPKVRCPDQSDCDFDPTPGRCAFRIAWCLNEPGCGASGVRRVKVRGPASGTILQTVAKLASSSRRGNATIFAETFTAQDACTELMSIPVSLRKNGSKPGKVQIKAVTMGARPGTRDPDKIRLICMP